METFTVDDQQVKRPGFSSRSRRNCCIVFCLSLLVGIFASLVTFKYIIGISETQKKSDISGIAEPLEACEQNICSTRECITIASRILSFIDTSVDPCDDFYQYACGNYGKHRALPGGAGVVDLHSEAIDNILVNIKNLLDVKIQSNPHVQKASALYHQCLNKTRRKENSSGELLDFLNARNMNWPIVGEAPNITNQKWTDTVLEVMKYGFDTLFKPTYHPPSNNGSILIELECLFPFSQNNINPFNTNDSDYESQYFENLIYIQMFKMRLSKNDALVLIRDILQMEREITNAYKFKVESHSTILSEEYKHQLQNMWSNFLNVSENLIKVTCNCNGNLNEALNVLNAASKKTVLNYVRWVAVSQLIEYLDDEFIDLYNHYGSKYLKKENDPDYKWKQCADITRKHMGLVLAKELKNREYLNFEKNEKEIQERFLKMKQAFIFIFRIIPWLDNRTANSLAEKIEAMDLQVGYPKFMNDEVIDAIYQDLHFDGNDTFYKNIMKLRQFNTIHYITKLKSKFDDNDLRSMPLDNTPLTTNSMYNYQKNRVEIGIGVLVSPLFRFIPGYLEFGQETILAHEISHALDTKGILLDSNGDLIEEGRISVNVRQKYNSFVRCLVHQRTERSLMPIKIQNIDNDIADLGTFFLTAAGLDIYLHIHQNDTHQVLPISQFDEHQIYILQATQMFCEKRENFKTSSSNLPKSQQKHRVNKAIANMMDFDKRFGCKPASPMNPMNKCNLLTV